MKRLSWKYIAGLIDGEGCIDMTGHRSTYMVPRVRVAMSEPGKAVIDMLHNNLGGHVTKRTPDNDAWAPSFVWEVKGRRCRNVLQNIKRFLVIKRNQADFLIKFIDTYLGERIPITLREDLSKELKAMKKDPQRLSDPAVWKHIKRLCSGCKSEFDKSDEVRADHGKGRLRFCSERCHLTWLGKRNSRISATKLKR